MGGVQEAYLVAGALHSLAAIFDSLAGNRAVECEQVRRQLQIDVIVFAISVQAVAQDRISQVREVPPNLMFATRLNSYIDQ